MPIPPPSPSPSPSRSPSPSPSPSLEWLHTRDHRRPALRLVKRAILNGWMKPADLASLRVQLEIVRVEPGLCQRERTRVAEILALLPAPESPAAIG